MRVRAFTSDWSTSDILTIIGSCRLEHQPLGFYRFFLTTNEANQDGFFLHAWLTPEQGRLHRDPAIHAHTFDMVSRVLCGELRNATYEIRDEPGGSHYRVLVHYNGGFPSQQVLSQRCSPRVKSVETVRRGEEYNLMHSVPHTTEVTKYPLITLMKKNRVTAGIPAQNVIPIGFKESEVQDFDRNVQHHQSIREAVASALQG